MILDIAIIIFLISALFRGREIGFVRQLLSTIGFFTGLFIGAIFEPNVVTIAHSAGMRAVVALCTTLGSALILLSIGEYVGMQLKHRLQLKKINKIDTVFGAGLSVVSLLISIWLGAAIINALPLPSVQNVIRGSHIIALLDRKLPAAPTIIADLGKLIDPNGFPQVFVGVEPDPAQSVPLPDLGALQAAVTKDRASVVKIEGQGCGGIVEGSGFVVAPNLVATDAHVVAGIKHPTVQDANGTHSVQVIWFDANLDFAVLRVPNLAGHSLLIASGHVANKTPAAALGYPGGGAFSAVPAAVLDDFTATGRNIYGSGNTNRDVYELQADIIPGNSGGPLVNEDGSVIGIVFAQSTTYNHVGYALTTDQVISELNQAQAQNQVTGTGSCAE